MLPCAVLRCAQKHARPRNRCLRASGRGEARGPPRQGRRGHAPIHVRYFVRCLLSMVYAMYMRCRVRLWASAPRRAVRCYNTTGRSDAIWRRRLRNAAVCASAVLAEYQGGSPRSRGPTSSKTPEVAPTVSHGAEGHAPPLRGSSATEAARRLPPPRWKPRVPRDKERAALRDGSALLGKADHGFSAVGAVT